MALRQHGRHGASKSAFARKLIAADEGFSLNACYGGKGGDAPEPDPAIGEAAKQNAEIGREVLAFSKQQYEDNKPRVAASDALIKSVVEDSLATSAKQQANADEQWQRFKTTWMPIEDKVASDAMNADSQAELNRISSEAAADTSTAADAADASRERAAFSLGINPNSGRFAGQQRASGIARAATMAGAMNSGRQAARDRGIALRAGAANFGRNMPNTAANAYGLAVQAGQGAVGTQNSGLATQNAAAAPMYQGFNSALAGNQSAANILNQQYAGQVGAYNAAQQEGSGMGQLLGTGLTAAAIYF